MGFLAVGQGVLWILVFRPHFSGIYAGPIAPTEHHDMIREDVTTPTSNSTSAQSTEELIENILFSIVPDNLIVAAMTPNILSVLSFSVVFGLILARIHLAPNERNLVQVFFNQVNITLLELVEKIIKLTPIAVFFLITGEIGGHPQLFPYLVNLGIMTATIFIGLTVHVLVFYFLAFVIVVRKSPFKLIAHLKAVFLQTFSRASAVITLPKAMEVLEKHYGVPNNIARFLMSMGVTLNIDGLAVYLPAAVVFLMEITDRRADIPHLLLTAIVATFGSAGSSAVPGSSLIMIILTWQALFPNERIPIEVSLITAVDWLLERCVACVTLFGDCVMTLVVNEQMKKSEARKLMTAKQLDKQAELIKNMAGLASYHNRDVFYEQAEETRQQRASIVLGAHKIHNFENLGDQNDFE
jgi:Na+/H+-dicarboxylate symporter